MKAPNICYLRVKSLSEAVQALSDNPNAIALAGGQSLLPMLNLRLARPELLIDISRLPETGELHETGAGWVIGSSVTHAQIEDARHLFRTCPLIPEVAAGIAYRSVRNLGTIGGSLAHADPAADWPVVLAALEGTIRILGSREQRRSIPVAGFIQGPFTTSLESGELIEAIEISRPPMSTRFGYYKFCRKAGDFPEASAAVVLDPDHLRSRIYVGALSGPPLPLHELASDISKRGRSAASEPSVAAAVRAAAPDLEPVEIVMHVGAVLRAVESVLAS